MMLLNKRRTVTPLVIMLLSTSFFHKSKGQLGFDIYGDSSRFDPKHSVTLDEDLCEYTAELEFDVQNANVPFPPIMPGPFDPGKAHPCNFDTSIYIICESGGLAIFAQALTHMSLPLWVCSPPCAGRKCQPSRTRTS